MNGIQTFLSAAASATITLIAPSLANADSMGTTSLNNKNVEYQISDVGYHVMQHDGVKAVIVDNRAVDNAILPGHRAGYSGVAKLTHMKHGENLFVPSYAGLNFEHIHDGTTRERSILYEPRNAPCELRVVSDLVAELYWPPTPTFALECCLRYELLDDGVLELTIECIPHAKRFKRGYIGLFFASYINQPESLDIHFKGVRENQAKDVNWIRGITPQHGELPTHLAIDDDRSFSSDADFPLSLVFNRSNHRYSEPWYYGISHGMAWLQVFRRSDGVRITQSPSGGGGGNPAWDFQYLIEDYNPGHLYQFVMRGVYCPVESPEAMSRIARKQMAILDQ